MRIVIKSVALSGFLMMSFASFPQDINRIVVDDTNGKQILLGLCDRHILENGPMADAFHMHYASYQVHEGLVSGIAGKLNTLKIVVVFGSWCSDSHEQLPRFFRILDAAGFSPERLELIACDKNKTAPADIVDLYRVERVPTFIFFNNDKEIGRIVEFPSETLEADIVLILSEMTF